MAIPNSKDRSEYEPGEPMRHSERPRRQVVTAYSESAKQMFFSQDFDHEAANNLERRVYFVETTWAIFKAHDLTAVLCLWAARGDQSHVLRVGSVG